MDGIWLVSYIVLWLVVIFMGVLIVLLYRQLGIMYLGTAEGVSRDGLATGSRAPEFELLDAAGATRRLSDYRGKKVLLLFGSPSCDPCRRLMPGLQEFARERAGAIEVLWLNDAGPLEVERFATETGAPFPMLADSGQAMDKYEVRVTPFMFMVDEGGVIRVKGLVNNKHWLDRYFTQLMESRPAEVAGNSRA